MKYKKEVLKLSRRMRLISINKNYLEVQAKYGPSKIVKLPLKINKNLSCFTAVIIGDGHLCYDKFRITVESCNKELLSILSEMVLSLFNIKTSIKEVKKREGKIQTYHLSIYSKAVFELLNIIFDIRRGKKSSIVRIPKQIIKGNKCFYSPFIIGLLIAEGSRKGKKEVRICSASKRLLEDIKIMLERINISSKIESWFNKKYKKEYYSISFKRIYLNSLMRECRSGQTGQILSIFKKIIEDQA